MRKKWLWLGLAISLAIATPRAKAQGGQWISLPPFPEPHEEVIGQGANGKMYVFAGLVSAPIWLPVGMVYEYDPPANKWTKKKPMALPAHHLALTEMNGKIYVFGGFTAGKIGNLAAWTPIDNAFEYDPVNDSWKALAPMPTKRGSRDGGRQDVRDRRRNHCTRRNQPRHPSHRRAARAQHSGRIRSRDQHLAHSRSHAHSAESYGRGRCGRQDLCDRRKDWCGIYRGVIRSRQRRGLRSRHRHLGPTSGQNANRTQWSRRRRLQRPHLRRRRRESGLFPTYCLSRI